MSDAAAAEDGKAPVAVSAGIPMKMVIIIVVGTLLLGIGAAFAIFKMTSGGHGGDEAKTEASEPKASEPKAESHGESGHKGEGKAGAAKGVMFDVDPFIVNLADAQDVKYLKLTVKLEMDNQEGADALTERMPQVRDTILVLLTSKESSSIRTTQGKFQLRDEITQRVNSLLPKPAVHTVYFTDFVVQ